MAERSEVEPFELHGLLSADADGPAQRIDAAAEARLIENVLGAVYSSANVTPMLTDATNVASIKQRTSKRKLAWALAAAFVITGSAAAMYKAQQTRELEQQRERDAGAKQRAREAARDERATVAAAPAPIATATRPATLPQAPAPSTRAALDDAASGAVRGKPRATAHAEEHAGDDLLQRANHLRGDGDYRAAESAYQKVVTTNPRSAAAYAARVAAADLRLERLSDARGALRLYADALRQTPAGALTQEIREGMASAYRALGRTHDEQQTLRALLGEQTSGPAAERARARLAVLDAHP